VRYVGWDVFEVEVEGLIVLSISFCSFCGLIHKRNLGVGPVNGYVPIFLLEYVHRVNRAPYQGVGIAFGPDVTRRWCTLNGVAGIIRSHEVRQSILFLQSVPGSKT